MNKHIANDIMPLELQAQLNSASHGTVRVLQTLDIADLLAFGFEYDEIIAIAGGSVTLISRIDASEPLTSLEYESLQRIIRFKDHAIKVFGTSEKPNRWMRRECKALADAVPLQLLVSEAGAQIVEEQLFRIEHGVHM